MATKAEAQRAHEQIEAHPPVPKSERRPRRDDVVDTSLPGVSATDRKVGQGHSGERNVSRRAGEKGGPILEDSATGRPSRKSTRSGQGGVKPNSNLERRAIRNTTSPEARAARALVERGR